MFTTYLVSDGSFLKIGKAIDPASRVRELQTGNPSKLVLLDTIPGDREKELHSKLRDHKVNGEWFSQHSRVRSEFKRLAINYRRKHGVYRADMMTIIRSVSYDFVRQLAVVRLSGLCCVHMPGVVNFCERIDPGVKTIRTVSGLYEDTRYSRGLDGKFHPHAPISPHQLHVLPE